MRFVIVGAGGVGGAIGGRLWEAGFRVRLVARGAHADALMVGGLRLREPSSPRRNCPTAAPGASRLRGGLNAEPSSTGLWARLRGLGIEPTAQSSASNASLRAISARAASREVSLPIPVGTAEQIQPDEIVILAVKSQDTRAALAAIPAGVAVVCAQNGIGNEDLAARRHRSFGMLVWLYAVHLVPGAVDLHWRGCPGVLDLGAINGEPELADAIAGALREAGFAAETRPEIMPWKRAKLVSNLPGAIAAAGLAPEHERLAAGAIAEGHAVFAAAGQAVSPLAELGARCAVVEHAPIAGHDRPGGSLWQSVHRGASLEIDALNGEIVRRGLALGVPTPINAALVDAVRATVQ